MEQLNRGKDKNIDNDSKVDGQGGDNNNNNNTDRGDLNSSGPEVKAFGLTDTKAVDAHAIEHNYFWVNASPAHYNVPPFNWTNYEAKKGVATLHEGHPDTWDFATYKEYYNLS
mmetsp:Transcript_81305/g.175704  ORF Transcript_81305/g.175704 Transcript_81305/m.175704 type:complete len:113 (+) Transcript_81305:1661-1999(+)